MDCFLAQPGFGLSGIFSLGRLVSTAYLLVWQPIEARFQALSAPIARRTWRFQVGNKDLGVAAEVELG